MQKLLLLCFLISISSLGFGQKAEKKEDQLIQFSGVVLEEDSLSPLPFTAIIIKNSFRGTTSDLYGFFSLVATKGDTIEFSSIGYADEYYVIPDTLSTNRYSLIQLMTSDTFLLNEVKIYPWPSKSEFREAFVNLNLDRAQLERALSNLDENSMRALAANMPMSDGSSNFKYNQINRNSQLYTAGGYPSWTILNPLAWAQFIDSWKKGKFKR